MNKIPIDKYDSTTGLITTTSGFTYVSGQTAPVDAYIVGGKTATTHSQLKDVCERYLINYAVMEILRRDTALDLHDRQAIKLSRMESDIKKSYVKSRSTLKHLVKNKLWRDRFNSRRGY